MDRNKTALERAFELAASGTCRGIVDIGAALKREGFLDAHHLEGFALRKQLGAIIKKARAKHNGK